MAEPESKSLKPPLFLTRTLPLFQTPHWMEAERWRWAVANQPVSIVCRDTLINDLAAAEITIKARDEDEAEELEEDVDYYTDLLLNNTWANGFKGLDFWIEAGGQDLHTLPVGWNSEIVRWPIDINPPDLSLRPNPKGHPSKIVFMDGATVFPTLDAQFPLAQRIKGDISRSIFFTEDEIARTVVSPRPELMKWGWGMAPPEKIFLAILALSRGDAYYANLLLDTPEAGILDLMDMSYDSATKWIASFRELFTGIDPQKIGVLYEHEKAANYLPFGRPPTEMLLDETTNRYSKIEHAGYGLKQSDTGLGDGTQQSLSGKIRDERGSRRNGFAVTRNKFKNMVEADVLPPWLELVIIEKDEEARVQKGRAFLLAAQALGKAKEARAITPAEMQDQLVKDGFITVEVEEPEELELPPMLGPGVEENGETRKEIDKVPAEEGGRGDITKGPGILREDALDFLAGSKGDTVTPLEIAEMFSQLKGPDLGDESITAVPRDSSNFDQMGNIIRQQFAGLNNRAEPARLLRLIKVATREMFPDVTQAFLELSDADLHVWKAERLEEWFDTGPAVEKGKEEALAAISKALALDTWWEFDPASAAGMSLIMRLAFEEGATEAAILIQEFLFTEGLRPNPNIIGLNFNLTNPRTLAQLEANAAQLVQRVDDGTKFFIKRIITSGVDEGLASPTIAQAIRDGAGVEEILGEAGFTGNVIETVKAELRGMSEARTNSITNTEVAKAESNGRIAQWSEQGLTRKAWRHTGSDQPCPFCTANQDLGFVPIDFSYDTVFGPATALGPPAHPTVDHCDIRFDEEELLAKADTLEVWLGE